MSIVEVRLVGGVGNQLFSYFGGAALAGRHQLRLVVDVSRVNPVITGHRSSILDFDLPGEWIGLKSHSASRITIPKRLKYRVYQEISKHDSLQRFRDFQDYTQELGWDPKYMQYPPTKPILGYFQSWRYIRAAEDHGYFSRPVLKKQSPELESLISKARELRPISLHIRRGDYSAMPNTGLLGKSYYSLAVHTLRERGHQGPIWIFTDSPQVARDIAEGEIMNLPNPSEELVLMSSCAAHIIANSTFSWWGAWMNPQSPDVVAPRPWFKHGPDIQDLLPPDWITISHQED